MELKTYFENTLKAKEKREKELKEKLEKSDNVEMVKIYGKELEEIRSEITDLKDQLRDLAIQEAKDETSGEVRNKTFDPMKTVGAITTGDGTEERDVDVYSTMEYRMAFKKFIQSGGKVVTSELRADATTTTGDVKAVIPTTIMNEFIKKAKTYGTIFAKVRQLQIPGGLAFPIANATAQAKWIDETTPSDRQKAGNYNESVTFSSFMLELKVSESLLTNVMTLDMFETEIAEILAEGWAKAIDSSIISGTGKGQPTGIIHDPRVTNVVTLTEAQLADWTTWRKELFAKVPLAYRGKSEFLFPSSTVESYLMTMKDSNNRPVFVEAANASVGDLAGSFFGRPVTLVEPDIIPDFATAKAGDVIGVLWNPRDYAVNSNLAMGIRKYFDEDKNVYINKMIAAVDGKILDTNGCFLIKKGAAAAGK